MSNPALSVINLLPNPKFNANLNGWDQASSSGVTNTIAWSGTLPWAGSGGCLLTVTANSGGVNGYGYICPYFSPIPVIAGQTYSGLALVLANSANWGFRFQIDWLDASSTYISTDFSDPNVYGVIPSGVWTPHSGSGFIAPSNAAYARIFCMMQMQNAGQTGTFRIGAVQWSQTDRIDVYMDGDVAGCSWNGTPNASTSTRAPWTPTIGVGQGGMIRYTSSMWIADQNNNSIIQLGGVITGQVTASIDATIPMELTGSFSKMQTFTPYKDFLQPFLRLDYEDGTFVENQVGLFVVRPAGSKKTESYQTQTIKAMDLTWLLNEITVTNTYIVKKGAEPVSAAKKLLAYYGFRRVNIPHSPHKLTADMVPWPTGTPIGKIVNDIMNSVNYYAVSCDLTGCLTSIPYIDGTQVTSAKTYTSAPGGQVIDALTFDPTTRDIANQVTIVVDDPSRAVITSVRTNNDPNSDTSTVSLGSKATATSAAVGRVLSWMEKNPKLANQTVADATAAHVLQGRSNLYVKCDMVTLPDPTRGLHEYYSLNFLDTNGNVLATGQWQVRGWVLKLQPDKQPMVHHLSKLQSIAQVS